MSLVLTQRILGNLVQHPQLNRIGALGKNGALNGKGHSWMRQYRGCRVGVARFQLLPVYQTFPWFSWQCEEMHCLGGTEHAFALIKTGYFCLRAS